MMPWKKLLLTGYYCATLPARRRAETARTAQQSEPVRILFYHRIADEHPNVWTLSTRMFARQIHWLRTRFDVVSLAEAQARIASGRNRVPTACITFDDGYADNMRFAIPLLICHRIPFSYFVSTDHVLRGECFPHDVATGQPLAPNTLGELRGMAAAGVEIGGHTRSHADLGKLAAKELAEEISGSKFELEDALDCDVRYFAFPFGLHENMSSEAFQIALDAGYDGACSAYGGYNFPADHPFHLRRFHADPEFIRFKNWLTIDPRKVRNALDFEPKLVQPKVDGCDNAAVLPISPALPTPFAQPTSTF
jgi:peptidoglycan/xylan/chitin deacetylase (PgdA/CDA1 family)